MAQIYEGASILLSATWSTDAYKGCFVAPDNRFVPRMKTFTNGNNNTYEVHCHELLDNLQAPLYERGWVLQERTLSRRIVQFMEQELWWECREHFTCECGGHLDYEPALGVDLNWASSLRKSRSSKKTEALWRHIVYIYTRKSLTYPSDIFPALQGLARLVPSSMGRYLAGHWERFFIESLCWIREEGSRGLNDWRAPSWSWASGQGAVSWPSDLPQSSSKIYPTFISASTIPMGDDPMGQLSNGSVVLKGRCLAARVQERKVGRDFGDPFKPGELVRCLVFEGSPRSESLRRRPIPQEKPTSSRFPNRTDSRYSVIPTWDYEGPLEKEQRVVVLKLAEVRSLDQATWPRKDQFWLVLRAVNDNKDEYVRIGMLSTYSMNENEVRMHTQKLDARYDMDATEMEIKIV